MQDSHKTIVIRITGDSGDGIQLLGEQLTIIAAQTGHDVRTLPDFPAEIRAPAGTVAGISGFQLAIADAPIFTAGESLDVLVAMNPAGIKNSLQYLKQGGLLIINEDNFHEKDWQKAGLESKNYDLENQYQTISLAVMRHTIAATVDSGLNNTQSKQVKNFYILGLVLFIFEFPKEAAIKLIKEKFARKPEFIKANIATLNAGYNYGMTLELNKRNLILDHLKREPGTYRHLTGVEAVSLALATLATNSRSKIWLSGYPITPASAILHACAKLASWGIDLFQAEDEIAAICSCLGAAYGGKLALTCTSGPGFDLKTEALGLAIATELPLVVIDVQRAGVSTGLPTKTGQSDLNAAYFGRHGEAPLPVIAPHSPAECFYKIIEAFTIAIKFMTPVIVLMDAYLANCAEPWRIPDPTTLSLPSLQFNRDKDPYKRDEFGARSWNIPGTLGYIHQIGGLEKAGEEGKISYDPNNFKAMVELRAKKIKNIDQFIPKLAINGNVTAKKLLISWGSTYGAVLTAINKQNGEWAWIHLTHLNPLPNNLASILKQYEKVFIVELNTGQLCRILRAETLVDIQPWLVCDGQPLSVSWLNEKMQGVANDA